MARGRAHAIVWSMWVSFPGGRLTGHAAVAAFALVAVLASGSRAAAATSPSTPFDIGGRGRVLADGGGVERSLARAASASAQRRPRGVHGTVRELCAAVDVRKWPGGPRVGRVAAGENLRRYHIERGWALSVTRPGRRPIVRGYALERAFCPPSAFGRRAAAAARRLAANPPAGRPATPLARAQLRRVCSAWVYVRDQPLNRPVALLYAGDTFRASRRARHPSLGGRANGHAKRRGWVPRAALCSDDEPRAAEYRPLPGPAGSMVLAPPAVVACGARVTGRRMLQVGVLGSSHVTARLRDAAGDVVSSARFADGRPGRWQYATAGRYVCGQSYAVTYEAGGERTTFGVRVAAPPPAVTAELVPRVAVRPVAARRARRRAPTCNSKPQQLFAHGNTGSVGHGYHARPAISANGRVVAFDLPASDLVAGDDNGKPDVFVREGARGPIGLVSVALGGRAGNATSRAAAISADGRVVAFESSASDLVEGDRDGERDIFVRDLRAGVTVRVAPGTTPALSADGRRVAFVQAGAIYVADPGAAPRLVASAAYRPAISADGRFVAYETLVAHSAGDANGNWDVYRTRLDDNTTVLLSAGADGRSRSGVSLAAVLSANGSVAAFQSDAPLEPGDRSRLRDVFVRDVDAGRTTLVSANRCGRPSDGYNRYPSISADGRLVAFDSHATDLVPGAPRGRGQVYLRDLAARRTRVLSVTTAGHASARTSFSPALAAAAPVAAFPSFSYDLGPRDENRRVDIYRRDVRSRRTQRLSGP